ncbi:MAG: glycosyltransferase family 1 protein [Lachnospiraceae bacterium]|nr:glycosyltransferase family 1 protein [Lachnospiraceae bacterium]
MIRMLHITASMSPSGIGNFIMNAYRHVDHSKVQFDFVVCEHREVSFDEEIRELGGRVFYVPRKSVSPIGNFNGIRKIVRDGHYRFVFRHTDVATVALDLLAAMLGGADERVAHSHSTSAKKIWLHKLFRPFLNAVCTRRFACSVQAGIWMYGEKYARGKKQFRVITNGIEIEAFRYDGRMRRKVREEFGFAEETVVIGHVGNYMPVKNHAWMITVLAALTGQGRNAALMLVGDGALRAQMEEQIRTLGLEERVRLTGVRNDIPALLQAMDVFLFPSFYEGMPIALVEAQAAGLPCVISDVITDDVCITEQVKKISLSESADVWADALWGAKQGAGADNAEKIAEAGFDVRALGEIYLRLGES